MHYYARLNENQICTEVISRGRELPKDLDGFIKIPDYNETLLWRKWNGNQWSQERYEPSFEAELQEKVKTLEEEKTIQNEKITQLETEKETLKQSIAELSATMAMLQTPEK